MSSVTIFSELYILPHNPLSVHANLILRNRHIKKYCALLMVDPFSYISFQPAFHDYKRSCTLQSVGECIKKTYLKRVAHPLPWTESLAHGEGGVSKT